MMALIATLPGNGTVLWWALFTIVVSSVYLIAYVLLFP